jgi:hypothetical protein
MDPIATFCVKIVGIRLPSKVSKPDFAAMPITILALKECETDGHRSAEDTGSTRSAGRLAVHAYDRLHN